MRKYDMYIIKELFANFYYGREYFFYHLFKDYETANNRMKKILSKQIDYISSSIPAIRIYKQLIEQLQGRKDFIMNNGMFLVENSRGSVSFKIYPKKCVMQSTGTMDIDMIFMEALRKTEFNFLVVDLDNGRFGWIKPMKDHHYLETLSSR
ncbi:sporulation inhibitor of replication protein SirA [Caldifermentibacillus hisashii]|uniref:sporulation inhibitor of replication protein SirA n=1 Tax=Caldifermentibacillus hisashii TaxID=996558 RepID=UPI003D1B494E